MKSQKQVQKQPIYGLLEAMCLLRISAAIGYICHCSHSPESISLGHINSQIQM